jgi:hypothetical protein
MMMGERRHAFAPFRSSPIVTFLLSFIELFLSSPAEVALSLSSRSLFVPSHVDDLHLHNLTFTSTALDFAERTL